jgi:hypothetical protein
LAGVHSDPLSNAFSLGSRGISLGELFSLFPDFLSCPSGSRMKAKSQSQLHCGLPSPFLSHIRGTREGSISWLWPSCDPTALNKAGRLFHFGRKELWLWPTKHKVLSSNLLLTPKPTQNKTEFSTNQGSAPPVRS